MMADAVFVIHRRVEQVVATGTRTATPYGGMSNPMTTAGDIIVGGSAGVPDRLAIGAAGKVLGVVAGSPAWVDPAGGGGGAVDSVNGQTGVVVLDAADVGADVAGAATAAVAAHTALSDPHPQYLTPAEAASAYAPLAHVGSGGAAHANAIAAGAAGFMTGADKTKLNGIATGATQNSADATLLARANHTGTQTASTISDFASASRAQTEAELVAGTNVTITPSGSGATRQLTIAAAGGGTGMANPMTTAGDLIVGGAAGVPARLPVGAPGKVLGIAAGTPAWVDPSATGASLSSVQTFTGPKTLALTDINTYNVSQDATAQVVTLPAQATVTWTDHAEIHIERGAAGTLTIVGATGVQINGTVAGTFTLGAQYSVVTLKRKGANLWTLFGNAS